jgi:hypothetical protein
MDDQDKKVQGLKVADKRRFDSDGEEKSQVLEPASQVVANEETVETPPEETPINFGSFIMSLATQTLMQLGAMKPPPGLDIKVDREAARQTIDILAMLQQKTKGNLDPSEAGMLEEMLHSLRMAYVRSAEK